MNELAQDIIRLSHFEHKMQPSTLDFDISVSAKLIDAQHAMKWQLWREFYSGRLT